MLCKCRNCSRIRILWGLARIPCTAHRTRVTRGAAMASKKCRKNPKSFAQIVTQLVQSIEGIWECVVGSPRECPTWCPDLFYDSTFWCAVGSFCVSHSGAKPQPARGSFEWGTLAQAKWGQCQWGVRKQSEEKNWREKVISSVGSQWSQ